MPVREMLGMKPLTRPCLQSVCRVLVSYHTGALAESHRGISGGPCLYRASAELDTRLFSVEPAARCAPLGEEPFEASRRPTTGASAGTLS